MMKNSVSDILRRWPDRAAILADVLVVDGDLRLVAIHRWFQRDAVPAKYWEALLAGALKRGIPVTAADMVSAHAPSEGAAA